MRIPASERTFRVPVVATNIYEDSESLSSSTAKMSNVSRSTRSTKFGLYDMDDLLKIKKEAKLPIPKKESSSQATTVGKKRKTNVCGDV